MFAFASSNVLGAPRGPDDIFTFADAIFAAFANATFAAEADAIFAAFANGNFAAEADAIFAAFANGNFAAEADAIFPTFVKKGISALEGICVGYLDFAR